MGSKSTSIGRDQEEELLQDQPTCPEDCVKHPVLGTITKLVPASPRVPQQNVYFFDRFVCGHADAVRMYQMLQQKAKSRPSYFLQQISIRKFKVQTMCGDALGVRLFFQLVEDSLRARVQAFRERGERFSEQQVQTVLVTLATCLSQLHEEHMFLQFLSTGHVLIGANFQIKVVDNECINRESFQQQDSLLRGHADPELLRCVSLKRTQLSHFDPFKANVWAAGLVLLQMMTLERAHSVYNFSELKINWQRLAVLLTQAESFYSASLVERVRSMLREESWCRARAADLLPKGEKRR